jgi:hypothetical protein
MPIVVTFRDATSQFTSQSALEGSPPSARLVIPLTSERAVSPRNPLAECDLAERFSLEPSRSSDRVDDRGTKPLDPTRSERPASEPRERSATWLSAFQGSRVARVSE